MSLTIFSAPAAEPVSLVEAKSHLRVTSTDDDTLISALIVATREQAEAFTRRSLVTQTWDLTLDRFPETIEVPLPPLQSITSISYVDEEGVTQTMASSDYTVDTKSSPGRIVPAYGTSWPTTREIINAVTVRFVAGYGAALDVPQAIKNGMLLHIGHLYANRESVNIGGVVTQIPLTTDWLYAPYRITKL